MSASALADAKEILFTVKTDNKTQDAEFYPFDQDLIQNAADQRWP